MKEEPAEADCIEHSDQSHNEEEACKESGDAEPINEPVKYVPSNEGFNDANEDGICID